MIVHKIFITSKFFVLLAILLALFPQVLYAADPDPKLYEEICEIRQLFCGEAAYVLAASTVIALGIMVFIGKITWRTVIVTAAGLTIFLGAENVVQTIFTPPPGSDVVAACECS